MRWSAVDKCTEDFHSLRTVQNDNEVTTEVENTTMASRPLKKAKYDWQVKGRSKNGLSSPFSLAKTYTYGDPGRKNDVHESEVTEEMNVEESHIDEINSASCCSSEDNAIKEPPSIAGPSSSRMRTRSHVISSESDSASDLGSIQNVAVSNRQALSITDGVAAEAVTQNSNVAQEAGSQINYALRRWQSKQLAQGIIDNAINKVLGDLGIPSHQHDIINPNFNEPVNWGSYLNAQNIENEGVAEAIRQQGLQRKRYVQQPVVIHAVVRPGSNAVNDKDVSNLAATRSADVVNSISDTVSPEKNTSSESGLASFSYKAGLLTQNNKCQTSAESSRMLNDVESLLQPDDLLNTAVSCAISEKGLGVLNVNE